IITHKLKEVMNLADRVTVFRAGKVVGHREISETSPEDLASLMVGRKISLRVAAPPALTPGKAVMELRGLTLHGQNRHRLKNLNFSVREGEVVGIAGVEGNGQSELLQLLLHPREFAKHCDGELLYFGQSTLQWDAARVRESGVSMVPEDRHREGLLLESPLTE